jgi:hypothetical protein
MHILVQNSNSNTKLWSYKTIEEYRRRYYLQLNHGSLITYGGEGGTVPELLFEKKGLILTEQWLLVSHSIFQA